MTRRFRKPWSNNAFTQGKKRKGEVCSRPLVRFWLVSPTSLLGNQKRPFPAVTGKWKARGLRDIRELLNHLFHTCSQRIIQIPQDILYVLDADGEADEVGVTPPANWSSSESCWWVVLAG
jgi:hypothetical protein